MELILAQVLDDDLAREIYKEETRLLVANHLGCFNLIKKWADEKVVYLNNVESIGNSELARQHLSLMDALHGLFELLTFFSRTPLFFAPKHICLALTSLFVAQTLLFFALTSFFLAPAPLLWYAITTLCVFSCS